VLNITKTKGQIDVSVTVGIIFVVGIIVAASFGLYYFGFERPRREELQNSRQVALQTLSEYEADVGTPQFHDQVPIYRGRIQRADSLEELNSVEDEISTLYEREKLREELLDFSKESTYGTFDNLPELHEEFKTRINEEDELLGLEALREDIEREVTEGWRDHHEESIQNIQTTEIVMIREDSPVSEFHLERDNAYSIVEEGTLGDLKSIRFVESNTFEVPIIETFEKVPRLERGDKVDIFEHTGDDMIRRVSNTEVLEVVYSIDQMSTIDWTDEKDNVELEFSADLWEEIKAAAAGAENARDEWDDWAEVVVRTAREEASIGDWDLPAIYVVKVSSWEVASDLTRIEHLQDEKDVILIRRKDG